MRLVLGNPFVMSNVIRDGKGRFFFFSLKVHIEVFFRENVLGHSLFRISASSNFFSFVLLRDDKGKGVFVHDKGRGSFVSNDIAGNGAGGVSVATGGDPLLRRNKVTDNLIYVYIYIYTYIYII